MTTCDIPVLLLALKIWRENEKKSSLVDGLSYDLMVFRKCRRTFLGHPVSMRRSSCIQ